MSLSSLGVIPAVFKNTTMSVDINKITVFDDGEAWFGAEPYLLMMYFTVDGDSARIIIDYDADKLVADKTTSIDDLGLKIVPKLNVDYMCQVTKKGGAGNLRSVDASLNPIFGTPEDIVDVPGSTGYFEKSLKPIPIEGNIQLSDLGIGLQIKGVPGFIGAVAVLMEHDSFDDHTISVMHQSMAESLQKGVDSLLSSISISNLLESNINVSSLKSSIAANAETAVRSSLNNLWDKFLALVDRDDQLINTFGISNPLFERVKKIGGVYDGEHGSWALEGEIRVEEMS